MKKTFVKRTAYNSLPISKLDEPAGKVAINLYPNATTFAVPPVPEAQFIGYISNYSAKYTAYTNGGATAHADFMMAEDTLLNAMDQNAQYVDTVAKGDRAIVILSGFEPTKEVNSPSVTPIEITGIKIKRGSTGELFASCDQQDGVASYVCIATANEPLPSSFTINSGGQLIISDDSTSSASAAGPDAVIVIFDFNKGRKKKFMGLIPGTSYYFTFFGINSAGVGPLSAPVSIVCY